MPKAPSEPAGHLGPVLIVEDDVLQADLLAGELADAGAGEIRSCRSASAALALLDNFAPKPYDADALVGRIQERWLALAQGFSPAACPSRIRISGHLHFPC